MNEVERLQGELAGLSLRVRRCEELLNFASRDRGDAGAAASVADEIRISPSVMQNGRRASERSELGRELRRRGWSATRIARVMGCAERTVQRW